MKPFLLFLISAILASAQVQIYTAAQLKQTGDKLAVQKSSFASEDLERYPHHYTLLAVRNDTGSSELHEHEADVFVVISGTATLVSGGRIVNPRTTRAGEIRGTSIAGGDRHELHPFDIVHIAANTAHQLLVEKGKTFTYFVLKVTAQ